MNTKRLILTALSVGAAFAAHASDGTPLTGCVELDGNKEIIRSGGSQNFLVSEGDAHYLLKFRGECGSLTTASRIEISTDGTADRLCAKDTRVKTDRQTCQVSKVELLDTAQFAAHKRASR